MKPLWAPLKCYCTAEELASPGVLLEKVQDYMNQPVPRTGETKVPTHDRSALMAQICRCKDKSEWRGVIEQFIYLVDKDAVAAARTTAAPTPPMTPMVTEPIPEPEPEEPADEEVPAE